MPFRLSSNTRGHKKTEPKAYVFRYLVSEIHVSQRRNKETNRICHWSLMQTEKTQPEAKRVIPETSFTELPALSVDPRVGLSRSSSKTDD